MSGTLLLLGLLFIIVLIHEAGHLIIAKRFGVGVPVYSIGFGPRIIGVKFYKGKPSFRFFQSKPTNPYMWNKGETEYRLAPIPFGGFCQMQGEMVETGLPNNKDLASKPFLQKVWVALGGAIANILTGFLAIYGVLVTKVGFIKAAYLTIYNIILFTGASFAHAWKLITGNASLDKWSDISTAASGLLTFQEIIIYFGIISIIMAVFNLLPFPALDGSLPFLWALEKLLGKERGQRISAALVNFGFFFLMALQVLIIIYWIITA